jgi:uncharacterized protein YjbI with pentapeptide repeats
VITHRMVRIARSTQPDERRRLTGAGRVRKILLLVVLLVLACSTPSPLAADDSPEAEAPLYVCKPNSNPHLAGLDEALRLNANWFRKHSQDWGHTDNTPDAVRLDWHNQDLCNVDLRNKDLRGAILCGAHLEGAHLEGAQLDHAHLDHAHLYEAHLDGAHLHYAHLNQADLERASLRNADLTRSVLDVLKLYRADFKGAIFEDITAFPNTSEFASVLNLSQLRFRSSDASLRKLSADFKAKGFRSQQKQVIFAIRRSEMAAIDNNTGKYQHRWYERVSNWLLFDITCGYGLFPLRPFFFISGFCALFGIVYFCGLVYADQRNRRSGIWAVWDPKGIVRGSATKPPQRLTVGFPISRISTTPFGRWCRKRWVSSLLLAMYFSVLSALRIGWHDFNVGSWIENLGPREYTLRATGWYRIVSGIQSLISVYFVALFILSYFSIPFDY